MNKTELIIAAEMHRQSAAVNASDAVLTAIAVALRRGEKVELNGFGSFSVVETPARTARNPRTGEAVQVAAGRKVKFKPSKTLLG